MVQLVISARWEQIRFFQFFFFKVGLLKGNRLRMELINMSEKMFWLSSKYLN